MMRATTGWAVAVRTPSGQIEAISSELPRLSARTSLAKVPFLRGVLVLGESLNLGFRSLSWSAQMATGEEEKPLTGRQVAVTMAFAMAFFLALFIVVPAVVAGWLVPEGSTLWFNALEGLARLGLFVGYIWAIGLSKDIQRVFAYHGAEHMTIHAFEAGEPLSVDSVARYRPEHPRCGTSFLLIVVLGSILVFSLLGRPGWVWLIASRVLLIPAIAGVAYEVIKFSGARRSQALGRVLAAPGLWLQRLTTRLPDRDQIEVAVASMLAALDDRAVAEV
ncbi:MAG: DUF1385 domain-containing protein, partial [Acidimicrobiia bacterium]